MSTEPNEANDHSESGSTNDGSKNEEFLRFERTLKNLLSIPPDEAREIVSRTPYPKDEEEKEPESN